ncbi:hypothetical protein DZC73_25240 [Albitalea terrae]|uniref:Uncharacterized protein n=2 Tax=Piscinibacter terrae TaxID=2496871 RepID=A0A3N7ISC3_9BURK|nr:hypothetical protein DZC73_25240 [Albitalea terrae]
MRLSNLIPMLLYLGNLDSPDKPGGLRHQLANLQANSIDAGVSPADVPGGTNRGLDDWLKGAGQDPSAGLDTGSAEGVPGLDGAQGDWASSDAADASLDNDAQQTTAGPELDQMLEFMRSFVDMLEQMQTARRGGGGADGDQQAAGLGDPSAKNTGSPNVPAQQVPQTSEPAKPTEGKGDRKQYTLDGGGSYTHHLVNDTDKPMDIAYFKNNGPGPHPGMSGESLKVHLEPGETADVSIPDNWQGRAQKYGGKMDDPATWAEFNNEPADASKGRNEAKTWFDVSKIPGGNANVTMKTGDGVTAGSDHSMLEAAKKDPRAANLLTKDAAGNDVFKPAQGFDGKTNKDVVDFFTQYEPEKAQGVDGNAKGKFDNYILPNNDSATRVSQSREMTLTFGQL